MLVHLRRYQLTNALQLPSRSTPSLNHCQLTQRCSRCFGEGHCQSDQQLQGYGRCRGVQQ
jgi:hypothetical protein